MLFFLHTAHARKIQNSNFGGKLEDVLTEPKDGEEKPWNSREERREKVKMDLRRRIFKW